MRPAVAVLALLMLANIAAGQTVYVWDQCAGWVACQSCPHGSCPVPQPYRQPRQQNQPQTFPQYKPRPLVPVKPIPVAEAPPPAATPKPEPDIDWKTWEKSMQDKLEAVETTTALVNKFAIELKASLASQKPCDCDNTALLARLTAIEAKLNKETTPPTPAPSGSATPTDEQFYYDVGPRKHN